MKREDALRIKKETPSSLSPSSSVPSKPQGVSSNLPFRPATPPVSEPSTYEEEDLGDINLDNFSNIEADREWYNIDEESALARDNEIDEDLPQRQRKRIRNTRHPKRTPKTSFNESGATFNEFGEYIDYDHQQSLNELNRIPITSHVFIPPFLENLKQYLQLQISGSSIRGIGPTVNPVKILRLN